MALVGENGAGKSTIINILGGIYTRDEGEILIDGKDAGIHGIQDAKAAGTISFIRNWCLCRICLWRKIFS